MADKISERLKISDEGALTFKATPEEFLTLACTDGVDFPMFLTLYPAGADQIAFSYFGIIVYCEDLRSLKELQQKWALDELIKQLGSQ